MIIWNCQHILSISIEFVLEKYRVNIGLGEGMVPLTVQAITWASVDSDLCRHMASSGHNWHLGIDK